MKALLIVDMQNDFMPEGALAVEGADRLVGYINSLMERFDVVVASQDYHPHGHLSFADSHHGKETGDVIELFGRPQRLWPVHCVQGRDGSEFVEGLDLESVDLIVKKGTDREIDSYSAFFDNAKLRVTDLDALLKQKGVESLHVVGVALDYCVKFTVLDALDLGYEVTVDLDGCRGVGLGEGDIEQAIAEMERAGAEIVGSPRIVVAGGSDDEV